MRERGHLEKSIGDFSTLEQDLRDAVELIDLGEAEGDTEIVEEAEATLVRLQKLAETQELQTLLSGEADANDCFLEVNSGAGGTESQDWAQMLYRMYTRWAEAHGYKVELMDESVGEEAGIKSASVRIQGHNAYGWLKTESGVHRLVRISPYDSSARRHTSFASVWVYPEIDDDIDVEVDPSDLRVDTYRSQGAGGQHVNTTDSAIRISHMPSGIVVTCQDEKSQHKNKAKAMKILRARLYEHEQERQNAEMAANRKSQVGSGDRSQRIRTYNCPQGRVTDHRIGLTLHKLDDVIAGDLDELVGALTAEDQAARLADVS